MDNCACNTGFQFLRLQQPHLFDSSARNRDPLEDTRLSITALLLRQLRILSQAYNPGIHSILTATITTFIRFDSATANLLFDSHQEQRED